MIRGNENRIMAWLNCGPRLTARVNINGCVKKIFLDRLPSTFASVFSVPPWWVLSPVACECLSSLRLLESWL
jgi:hypothetical protein